MKYRLIFGFFLVLGGGCFWTISHLFTRPSPEEFYVLIQKGCPTQKIAQKISTSFPLPQITGWLVYGYFYGSGKAGRLQAGEYKFPRGLSLKDRISSLCVGSHRVVYRLTLIEGETVQGFLQKLREAPALEGDVAEDIPEGSLQPDTYHYFYGEKRQQLLDRMRSAMKDFLEKQWFERPEGSVLTSIDQWITLASIVEKETGLSEERPKVAAVFLNRLRKGMRLQADPTVAYGLQVKYQKNRWPDLTKRDLKEDTPYNTYTRHVLPPRPIACPGEASLKAVLFPDKTSALYFVAKGNGAHIFSEDLATHQYHHQELRRRRLNGAL